MTIAWYTKGMYDQIVDGEYIGERWSNMRGKFKKIKTKNQALLNCKSDSHLIRYHCMKILKRKK